MVGAFARFPSVVQRATRPEGAFETDLGPWLAAMGFTYNQWLCEISGSSFGLHSKMKTIARDVREEDADPDEDFKPLTAEEAQRLRDRNPSISPWRVILIQVVAGLLVALVTWGLTGRRNLGWSAAYGALAVVLPAAVFARGLTGRFSSLNPGTAVFGFFLWEMVKMALSVAMLIAAPRLITALSWPAMLVGLVVTMKAAWVAVMMAPRRRKL